MIRIDPQSFSKLPPEIFFAIFSYLDHHALSCCRRVSRDWLLYASDEHLWRDLFHHMWPTVISSKGTLDCVDYYGLYIACWPHRASQNSHIIVEIEIIRFFLGKVSSLEKQTVNSGHLEEHVPKESGSGE